MANGFDYESPINRLLSVTIPQFIEGQLNRQESARRFDEQQAFRQQQFDAQIEQQARQNEIMDKALKTEELNRENTERLEIENSMLSSIQLESDSENALRLAENFEFKTVQGKSRFRVFFGFYLSVFGKQIGIVQIFHIKKCFSKIFFIFFYIGYIYPIIFCFF